MAKSCIPSIALHKLIIDDINPFAFSESTDGLFVNMPTRFSEQIEDADPLLSKEEMESPYRLRLHSKARNPSLWMMIVVSVLSSAITAIVVAFMVNRFHHEFKNSENLPMLDLPPRKTPPQRLLLNTRELTNYSRKC